jgi:hypothetical protein
MCVVVKVVLIGGESIMVRWVVVVCCVLVAARIGWAEGAGHNLDAMIARHAAANGVPVSLVRRVIRRESRYNPRAVSRGNYGLMQIRLGTARAMGYRGSAAGLLDPDTNMRYAVRYLAGAYHAAGGNEARAQAYYQSGYYGRGRTTAIASRRTAPAYTQTSFATWRMASARDHHRRFAMQTTALPFNWQTPQPAPSTRHRNLRYAARSAQPSWQWQTAKVSAPRHHRNLRYATGPAPTLFTWNTTQRTATHHHRNLRYATGPAPTLFTWNTTQRTATRHHRNLRYATGVSPTLFTWNTTQRTATHHHRNLRYATGVSPYLFDWRATRPTSVHRYRSHHARRAVRPAPTLLQSLTRLFNPPQRHRVARLNGRTTR